MKIRHVVRGRCNPDNADGIIRNTYFLAHAQLRLGHDVAVYGLESRAEDPEVIDRDGLRVHAFPRTRSPFSVHPALKSAIQTTEADVDMVHIQVPHDPAMYALSRELISSKIPYFVSPLAMWEPEALDRHRVRKLVYKRLFDNRMNRAATGIHATGAAEVAAIHKYAPGAPVFVVRNSIDLKGIDAVTTDGCFWRERFGLSDRIKIFVFLGRLDVYQKGLDVLIEAWAEATKADIEVRLALIGPSWRGGDETLTELISSRGVRDSVIRTGQLFGPDKYRALKSANCYVQVSRYESTPFAVQEAFASFLPAILTPGTTLADMAERYGAGWKVALDPEAIAAQMKEVFSMSNSDLTKAGAAARRLVEERHSLDRAAERTIVAYNAALNGSGFENDD